MSEDDEGGGNIIQFPSLKKQSPEQDDSGGDDSLKQEKIIITKESVERLVKALSTIHMATTYRARKNEDCKENIRLANFPCKLNCACYVNICAAMGLESFLGGESQEEAIMLVNAEHELIRVLHEDLIDEDLE